MGIFRDITERKRAEERLRKEAERGIMLLELYEKAPLLTEKQLYDYVLDQAVRLTDSAIGFFHLVSDDQKTVILTTWNKEALKNCTASHATHYSIDRAGNWVDCVRLKRPVIYNDFAVSPNQKGLPEGHSPVRRFMSIPVMEGDKVRIIFGVGNKAEKYEDHDVVQIQLVASELQKLVRQRRAEEALRQSEEKYRTIFEESFDGLFITSPEGKILDINRKGVMMFGYDTKEEMLLLDLAKDVYADPTVRQRILAMVNAQGSAEYEIEVKKKNGERMITYCSLTAVKDEKGVITSYRGIIRDVTERKQAEAKMAMLYQKVKEEAEVSDALLSIVEALNTSLDEQELIKRVVNLAPRYLKYDRIGIFLYDEDSKGFAFSRGYGLSPVEEGTLLSRSFKAGDFPAMDKAIKGETVIIEDATKADLISREMVDTFGIRSAVIVPISSRGNVIGGIYADYKTVRAVETKYVSFLKGLADGMAIALQNSRLYRESVERLMQLSGKMETIKTMAQIDQEILSNIDRTAILRTATALINRAIPCDRTAIVLREEESFRIVSEWGLGQFQNKTYPVKGSHIETFEKNRTSVYLGDLGRGECDYHREQESIGIKSALLIPLITKEGVIGFLDIGSMHYGRLTPGHLSTAESVSAQISVALENARLYEELQQLLIGTITSLSSAVDAKSPWTKGHSERVTRYALEIGKEMGLGDEDLNNLRLAGLLHDVGKIGTYDVLLDKLEKFTAEEFEIVKKHPGKGAEILSPIKQLGGVIPGILHHHERVDGRGYPEGLKNEEIPLCARILCVADSFDAMTADRPYRAAPGKEYAISELKHCSGTHFDSKVVETFLKVLDKSAV
jgi:PAS domain S-box-containing protein/putative nucleotidyltransferase with HDIG domain